MWNQECGIRNVECVHLCGVDVAHEHLQADNRCAGVRHPDARRHPGGAVDARRLAQRYGQDGLVDMLEVSGVRRRRN